MDAAARVGAPVGGKTSTGYCPPELASVRFVWPARGGGGGVDGGDTVAASPAFDVWSFGVVAFERCAGRTLFAQDMANDELVDAADRTRLCTWLCAADEELAPVLPASNRLNFLRPTPHR